MAYNVYKNDELIAEGIEETSYTVTGLKPDTEYTFKVSEVKGDLVSGKSSVTVKTEATGVTSVELSPKNMSATAGAAGDRNLSPNVLPKSASNKDVSYSVSPSANGLNVSSDGVLSWTDETPAGTYTVAVRTADGGHTAESKLTLSEPEPEPEPDTEDTPE